MALASKDWQFVKLDSTNQRQIKMITAAQEYFQNQFTETPDLKFHLLDWNWMRLEK